MEKEDLFTTVLTDGVLPKKTFSMGEANEKRYYLEARALRPAHLCQLLRRTPMLKAVKFGGSSLADAHQFQKVRDIYSGRPGPAVSSCPARPAAATTATTRSPIFFTPPSGLPRPASPLTKTFGKIFARYTGIRSELGLSTDIESALAKVKDDILARASADYAASRGRITSTACCSPTTWATSS